MKFSSSRTLPGHDQFTSDRIVSAGILSIFLFIARAYFWVTCRAEYLDPDFLPARQLLAILYARFNRPEDALREAARAVELSGHNLRGRATLGIVCALVGRRTEAHEILRELQDIGSVPGFRWSYARAIIHCYLGEREAALDCISQACEERDGAVMYLRHCPHLAELRNEQRFRTLLDKTGF